MPVASQAVFGDGTRDPFALYERAIAAGMTQERAGQLLSGSSLEDFEQEIARLESTSSTAANLGDLGQPVYSPARTRDTDTASVQRGVEQVAAQQAAAQQAAAQQASRQLTPEQQAIEDRYGNDMAWLDPSFQYEASTVAPITSQDALQYGTTADPAAQAQQQRAIDQLFSRASAGASGDERFAMNELDNSMYRLNALADRGATPEERAALATQSGAANDLLARGRAGATEDERAAIGDQRRAMEALFGDYARGASDVELEAQAGQRRAMQELFGVWEGGGATALERARRAQARAESENWLQGQRKADMQDLAERGMSGSGAELASLQSDRQAAASRLSMADLQTDADLEARAMEALLGGSGVAGELLAGESGIQARRLQQLFGASDAARGVSGTLGDIEGRSTQQLASGGGLAGDVAQGWGGIENRGLQARLGAADAASAYGGIAGDVESRALEALFGAQSGASDMRNASDRYVQQNADRLFDASTFNADAINRASADNKAFMQNAYRDTMADRTRWDMQTRDLQTGVARDLFGSDVQENQYGYGAGYDTAASDVAARNRAQGNYNNAVQSAHSGSAPVIYDAQGQVAQAGTAGLRAGADTAQAVGQFATNYLSGGMAGMGRQPYSSGVTGSRVTNPTDEQNPYRNVRYT
jgi:hypothetical protein